MELQKLNEISKIDIENLLENLKCPICLDYYDDPVMEILNQHIFCKKCILRQEDESRFCPICKQEIIGFVSPRLLNSLLSCIELKCQNKTEINVCQWIGTIKDYWMHQKSCDILITNYKINLDLICKKQKSILDKEINSHLKHKHLEIYLNYTKDWEWLVYDKKDWKWWWWCSQPWWENKSCEKCNNLWHKYENEIDVLEKQRIYLINQLNSMISDT
jgi:hypothetical protein